MSRAEELLDSMTEDQITMRGTNPVDESHIVIESDKTITVPDELKHIAVQGDHNIETVTFDCPRYWDGHDLSQMSMRIVYQRPDGYREPHLVENLRVDEADENTIHFDWTISGNVTAVRGNISFMVCGKRSNADGVREREWHTRLSQDLTVDEGMDCFNDEIVEQNPDIIEAILVQLDELQTTGGVSDEQIGNAVKAYMEEHPIDSGQNLTLSRKQVNALDALFRVVSYIKKDVSSAYAAFCDAFGIVPPVIYQNEIKKGSSTFHEPSGIRVNTTMAVRAVLVPIGRYLTKGKVYKFSLGSASADYYYAVQIISASEAGLEFDYVADSNVVYDGLVSLDENSDWTKADLEYVISKENCVLCVGFRNNGTTELTEDDYEILQNNFVLLEEEFEVPDRTFTILLHRTVGKLDNNTASISQGDALGRMMIRASVANSRRFAHHNGQYWVSGSNYSPVPIPNGAVSAVYSVPNGMKFGMAFLGEDADSETNVKYLKDTNWLSASTGTIDVTSYNDGNHYWSANLGYTDDREIPADFDEETIDVYFVDVNGNRLP